MEQKYSYYKKHAITKFELFEQQQYGLFDSLKKDIYSHYPVIITEDPTDYTQVEKYHKLSKYVWMIKKGTTVLKTFPWHFRPIEDKSGVVYQFPEIHKRSKFVHSWNSVQLVSTDSTKSYAYLRQRNISAVYDPYYGKEQFDIFYISDNEISQDLVERFPNIQIKKTVKESLENSTTDMVWIVPDDVVVKSTFSFDYVPDDWSYKYVHVFLNGKENQFDGIFLMPKKYNCSERELRYRFFSERKEVNILASDPKPYDIFEIDTYEEYLEALEKSTTEMFWMTSKFFKPVDDFKFDFYIDHHNTVDRDQTHAFKHTENNQYFYNGFFLLSKNKILSRKEIEYRSPIERKEWNIVASEVKLYDIFEIDSYEEYLEALEKSTTEMFWMTSRNLQPTTDFKFDLVFDKYNTVDRNQTHAFKHTENNQYFYNGIFLLSKNKILSRKEIEFRSPVERKEWDIVASGPVQYKIYYLE